LVVFQSLALLLDRVEDLDWAARKTRMSGVDLITEPLPDLIPLRPG
jgi:hypothetical protein